MLCEYILELTYLSLMHRFAYCSEQVKRKPGREVVTFLLVCNLAMWAINTLETNRADSHPIQASRHSLGQSDLFSQKCSLTLPIYS